MMVVRPAVGVRHPIAGCLLRFRLHYASRPAQSSRCEGWKSWGLVLLTMAVAGQPGPLPNGVKPVRRKLTPRLRDEAFQFAAAMMDLTRLARASIENGLVSACVPGSR
jgi:hypothetical protein